MAGAPYDPWTTLSRMSEELNRVFDARAEAQGADEESNVVTSHWTPAVDIREEPGRFVLLADLPGVDARDIEITMDRGTLSLRGERPMLGEAERRQYARVERARGTFHRRFTLPESVDPEDVSARSANGVLEVVILKKPRSQPRRIAIHE